MLSKITALLWTLAFLCAGVQAARADISVEGGAFVTRHSVTEGGLVSVGLLNTPLVPFSAQVTAAVPFNGAGYAATADARLSMPDSTQIGAGIGLGDLGAPPVTRVIYDAILAHGILPHVSIEGRLYFGPAHPSSLVAGVRVTL
jgi:hypothetical protein